MPVSLLERVRLSPRQLNLIANGPWKSACKSMIARWIRTKQNGAKLMRRVKSLLFAGLTLLVVWRTANAAQLKVLPGSAQRGEQLLIDKGCVNCHAPSGAQGSHAPDLSRTPPHAGSPELLASAMWNHATQMWRTSESAQNWPKQLTLMESADIFAYLYSTLYFAPPGDSTRGKAFFEKNCAACHTGEPGSGAAILSWKGVADPVIWSERMWNHSAEMHAASTRKGLTLPKLSNQDVADLMIYFRSLPALRAKPSTFAAGEPEQGLLVFERSCESCHSFGPGPAKTIDLLARRAPSTITGYIAEMWNHSASMRGQTGPPKLEQGEMSNLVAFLFSQSYFFQRGNDIRGRQVFEAKNCARCHEKNSKETGAPDLTRPFEAYSPITLTSAIWNHGPMMFRRMQQQGVSWPEFQGSEMADLIAYLNSRLPARVARPN